MLAHLQGQYVAVILLEKIADTSLARLRVDTDDVGIVGSADVHRVDGNIGNAPFVKRILLAVFHTLCDSILMSARKGGKHQSACIGCAVIDLHSRAFFVFFDKVIHIRKVKLRIDTVGIHIQCESDYIYVARALAVAEKRTFNAVCACQKRKLGICDTRTAVVMRMHRKGDEFTVFDIFAYIFDLTCIDVRKAHFDSYGKVNDDVVILARFENIKHGVDDVKRIFGLGACEGFGRIFVTEIALVFDRQTFYKARALDGEPFYLFLGFFKYLLSLRDA